MKRLKTATAKNVVVAKKKNRESPNEICENYGKDIANCLIEERPVIYFAVTADGVMEMVSQLSYDDDKILHRFLSFANQIHKLELEVMNHFLKSEVKALKDNQERKSHATL